MDDPDVLTTIEIPCCNARITAFDKGETPLLLTISTHRGGTFSYAQTLSVEAALKLMRGISDAVAAIHAQQRTEKNIEATPSGSFRMTQIPQMQQSRTREKT